MKQKNLPLLNMAVMREGSPGGLSYENNLTLVISLGVGG